MIQTVFSILNDMVREGVVEDYAVGGAIAATFYLEAGVTEDIDIFVHVKPETPLFFELEDIYKYLKTRGGVVREGYVRIADWDVQFLIPADGSLEDEAVRQANVIELHRVPVHVIMPEYLTAIALKVGREKDIGRARAFIKQDRVDVSDLMALIDRFQLEDQWRRLRQLL